VVKPPPGLWNLSLGIPFHILVILPGHNPLGGILRHILSVHIPRLVLYCPVGVHLLFSSPGGVRLRPLKKFGFSKIWSGTPSPSVLSMIISSSSPESGLLVIILILTVRGIRQWLLWQLDEPRKI
jgi:hypothetical protein